MLDRIHIPDPDSVLDDGDHRVHESAHRLFERLNPIVRDPAIDPDAEPLPIYDWEIAADAELDLPVVRSALRLFNGSAMVVRVVNEEHQVIAWAGH